MRSEAPTSELWIESNTDHQVEPVMVLVLSLFIPGIGHAFLVRVQPTLVVNI